MNVYDFDDTLYDGESIYDFFFFCLNIKPKLIIYVPKIIYLLVLYNLGKVNLDKLVKLIEKIVNKFIDNNIDDLVSKFWTKNDHKLKDSFINKLTINDVIITGCPLFLIDH